MDPTQTIRRAFRLDLSDEPDTLLRVLSLLHRRRCELVAVDYDAADPRRPRLDVRVRCLRAGGAARADTLEAGLRATIGVLGVTRSA